tara:strand:+ start:1946 stop:2587 length:642 start_codon:yes stop_codon:yes gene_type:complete
MNKLVDPLDSFSKVIKMVDQNKYLYAFNYIQNNLKYIKKPEDISLSYILCGFLSDKLSDYPSAIENFSKAILQEEKFEFLNERSKDIPYCGRSNSKYKKGDFRGAIEDKREAIKVRLLENDELPVINEMKIDSKLILSSSSDDDGFENKYKLLVKVSKVKHSKYDLINDYKKVISTKRKEEVINKLYHLSELKYNKGDYKGSIKAIRRAEKYY